MKTTAALAIVPNVPSPPSPEEANPVAELVSPQLRAALHRAIEGHHDYRAELLIALTTKRVEIHSDGMTEAWKQIRAAYPKSARDRKIDLVRFGAPLIEDDKGKGKVRPGQTWRYVFEVPNQDETSEPEKPRRTARRPAIAYPG